MHRWALAALLLIVGIPAHAGRGRWTSAGPPGIVYRVVSDPVRSGVVYASVGLPESLYRSLDGGRSWSPVDSPWPYSFAVDPVNPDVLYAGGLSISRSENAGETWSPIVPDLTANYVSAIVVGPGDPDVLSVETRTLDSGPFGMGAYRFAKVERSPGGAFSWSVPDPAFTTAVTELIADASSPGTLLASGLGGVYRTTDSGETWATLPAGIPGDTWVAGVAISREPTARIYAPIGATTVPLHGVAVSSDGGGIWEIETAGLPAAPLLSVAADPRHPEIAYVGSIDVGIFRTIDGGKTWRPFDAGLSSLTVYSIAFDAAGNRIYAGTADGVFAIDPLGVVPTPGVEPAIIRRR